MELLQPFTTTARGAGKIGYHSHDFYAVKKPGTPSNSLPIKSAKLKSPTDMYDYMLDEHSDFYKALLSKKE